MIAFTSDAPFPGLLLLLAIGAFIALGIYLARDPGRPGMLQRVARRVGGTYVDGGWFDNSRVDFRIAGRDARLTFFRGSKGKLPYSRVSVSLGRLAPGTLHVLEDGFGQSFLKLFGAQDLNVGDAAFDRDYVVKATPESFAARIFSPERRADVVRTVRLLKGFRDPTIDVTPQQLTVTVRQYFRDEMPITTLISVAMAFLDYVLKEPGAGGIALGELTAAADGRCPVCGTELRGQTVACAQCRATHHAECWTYMGRCSTYGCAGRRAV